MDKPTIVLGVIGADVHAVGNKILDYALSQAGFHMINIGVLASQEEFINAAIETNAQAILVSSLYGHGEIDCRGLREKCQESGIGDILLYAGGNLVVGKQDFASVQQRFRDMGFDRVYPPGTMPDQPIKDLRLDLGLEPGLDHGQDLTKDLTENMVTVENSLEKADPGQAAQLGHELSR